MKQPFPELLGQQIAHNVHARAQALEVLNETPRGVGAIQTVLLAAVTAASGIAMAGGSAIGRVALGAIGTGAFVGVFHLAREVYDLRRRLSAITVLLRSTQE